MMGWIVDRMTPTWNTAGRPAVIWMLALLVLPGCAAGAPGADTQRGVEAAPDRLIVRVENNSQEDVEVLFLSGTNALSLGFVASNTFERFSVSRAQFPGRGRVEMIARKPLGGEQFRSPPVVVAEGQGLLLRIGPQLQFSQLMIRR